jgi:hypothetical protein
MHNNFIPGLFSNGIIVSSVSQNIFIRVSFVTVNIGNNKMSINRRPLRHIKILPYDRILCSYL